MKKKRRSIDERNARVDGFAFWVSGFPARTADGLSSRAAGKYFEITQVRASD